MNLTVKTTSSHFCFVQMEVFFFICSPPLFFISRPLRIMPALQSSALLLLSGLLIGLSESLNPRDPNVCSLWERWEPSDLNARLVFFFYRMDQSLRDVWLVDAQTVQLKNLCRSPLVFTRVQHSIASFSTSQVETLINSLIIKTAKIN